LAWKDGSGMFLSSLGLYPGNTSCLWSFGTRLVGWGREGRGWIALLLDHVPLIHCCPLVGPKVRARVLHPNGKARENLNLTEDQNLNLGICSQESITC
jgi:hypothetical protein